MKQILILLPVLFIFSCSSTPSCDYTEVYATKSRDGVELQHQKANDCYTRTDNGDGTITIAGQQTGQDFYITYSSDGEPISINGANATQLNRLDVKITDQQAQYRSVEGDQIRMAEDAGAIAFTVVDGLSTLNTFKFSNK